MLVSASIFLVGWFTAASCFPTDNPRFSTRSGHSYTPADIIITTIAMFKRN